MTGLPGTVLRPGIVALAALGALAVLVAELTTLYDVVVGPLAVVERSVRGGANHGYALLPVGALALAMAYGAGRGSRSAAAALVALGVATLFVGLAIDLPDTRQSGRLRESVIFENARARAAAGLYLELLAGLLLVGTGAGLLALGRAQPRAREDAVEAERPAAGARPGTAGTGSSAPGEAPREDRRAELLALLHRARELAEASAARQGEALDGPAAPARAARALAAYQRRADEGELFGHSEFRDLGLTHGARGFDWPSSDRALLELLEQIDAHWTRHFHRPAGRGRSSARTPRS